MTGAGVTVRPGGPADRAFIETLGKRTVMDSVSTLRRDATPAAVLESFERLLSIVEEHSHVVLIAERDGERIGFLLLLDALPDEVAGTPQSFVAYMAVDRKHRKTGVGSAMLHEAERESRRRGLPHIALMVTEENAVARALYEHHGYVTERRLLCKVL